MQKKNSVKVQYSLPVSILKEGKYFIAYTPVLDLSTSGKSYEEVKMRFNEVVQIFIEELIERGTLDKVLTELGWEKINKQWMPPLLVGHESARVNLPAVS